ncbi:putative transcription factor AS2-LOB family [Medicago truncatula]|uniref:DUF260 family protein n=1 Tax=Medicago truncatula TaxID=3880 RepID=A0A072TMD2_MEDTR|nr:DUF260 family protein [Medicago truncatula]RHN38819.1 putative transcription factor AS2-LOB family [Medicago truncatula]
MVQRNRRAIVCLLCRHMRRRHDADCEFGQYFSANRNADFQIVIHILGLSRLIRIMRAIEPPQRQAVANSLLTEGEVWRINPDRGFLGHQLELGAQLNTSLDELDIARKLLAFCIDNANSNNAPSSMPPSTQIPDLNLDLWGTEHMNDMDITEEDMQGIPCTREKGESSNASKGMVADEKEKGILNEQGATSDEDEDRI